MDVLTTRPVSRRQVKRVIPRSARHMYHRVREWRDRQPGLPRCIAPETVGAISRQRLGGAPTATWHVNLSGYKQSNAFLVGLQAGAGRHLRIVAKQVPTTRKRYPAKETYPGPLHGPELSVFSHSPAELRQFLPELLHVQEVPATGDVQLFFVDVSPSHFKPVSHADVRHAVAGLDRLRLALEPWILQQDAASITTYDARYRVQLLTWSRRSLEAFVRVTGTDYVRDFLEHWPLIERQYLEADPEPPLDAVHGDFRRDHVFLDRSRPSRDMRVVDWEYAGRGWMHNDLVSLLKGFEPPLVRATLVDFARTHRDLSIREHIRMYNRALIERGLLDAALVVSHRLRTHDTPWVHRDHFDAALEAAHILHENRDAVPFEGLR